ncbi:hypothetical protein PIB30_073129 [Stylosanthes scabra]|uniref:Uncharacterized protein n=1 Tax=Stylosanthes scabra TaxID=79078 RepID=A0ABU6TQU7_9FABA|nr:hypothetical protein [Stylosanthes scabra]
MREVEGREAEEKREAEGEEEEDVFAGEVVVLPVTKRETTNREGENENQRGRVRNEEEEDEKRNGQRRKKKAAPLRVIVTVSGASREPPKLPENRHCHQFSAFVFLLPPSLFFPFCLLSC